MSVTVSVVIPTMFSQPQLVVQCLEALNKQQCQFGWEIILVVNQSARKSQSIIKNLPQSIVNRRIIYSERNLGFAGAMNKGLKLAKGNLLVPLNDDVEVSDNWLNGLVNKQASSDADMVASKIYLANQKTLDSKGFSFAWRGQAEAISSDHISFARDADYWLKSSNRDLLPMDKTQAEFWQEPFGPDAAACLYTRKMLDDVGYFDDSFFAYLEDVDLALRARMAGYHCVLAEQAVAWHHKHATSSGMGGFKKRQDMKNWWRVVSRYEADVWRRFWWRILVERLRNAWGYAKK